VKQKQINCALVVATAMPFASFSLSAAEAPEIILETGGPEATVSAFRDLGHIEQAKRWVTFDFGFATIEELLDNSFLDSATLTLQGSSPASTTIIATVDRSGVLWAPHVAGGISLDPNAISWTEIEFPGLSLDLPHRRAYSTQVELPEEFYGQEVRFIIDLFDNQNAQDSLAYIGAPTVVPEPGVIALAATALLFWFSFSRRNK
jgi:hypothetical protein